MRCWLYFLGTTWNSLQAPRKVNLAKPNLNLNYNCDNISLLYEMKYTSKWKRGFVFFFYNMYFKNIFIFMWKMFLFKAMRMSFSTSNSTKCQLICNFSSIFNKFIIKSLFLTIRKLKISVTLGYISINQRVYHILI